MSFKGAIFDLDGVIVNTVPLHFKAWKRMFEEYGKTFTFQDYKEKVDGIPRMDGARAILTDLDEAELDKAATRKQGYYLEQVDKGEVDIYESTVKLVKELKEKSIKVAAASSSRNCRYILEKARLIDLFDAVIGGGDFKVGKPAPDIFLLAASKINLPPAECIVFEDAKLGVEAAKNGKMLCIGIAREGHRELLEKADIIVEDLREIDYKKLKGLFKDEK